MSFAVANFIRAVAFFASPRKNEMHVLSEKELKVLRELAADSNRARKSLAARVGVSESEFSKITSKLMESGIIRKFGAIIDYQKLGFADIGMFIFSVKDKKTIKDVVKKLIIYKEIIEIQEVFGAEHDMIIRIMAQNNQRIREICQDIYNMDEINSDKHAYTLIFAINYKREDGIEV